MLRIVCHIEIRENALALLEADVNIRLVKQLRENVRYAAFKKCEILTIFDFFFFFFQN